MILTKLKAAERNHLPPTMLFGCRVGKPIRWTRRDLLLVEALEIYRDGLCPGCNQPRHLVHTEWALGEIEEKTVTCHACRLTQISDRKPVPGQHVFLRNKLLDPSWQPKQSSGEVSDG